MATIDVLLPVRNGLPFLGAAIESIRDQTFSDWRLLILDHGSSDGSLELAQKYEEKDYRIQVFSFPAAEALAGLHNAGLERCDCRYIMRQDADDISLPNRMLIVKDAFIARPHLVAVGAPVFTIDKLGQRTGYVSVPTTPAAITAASFFYNPILHPAVAANFAVLKHYGAEYGKDILKVVPASESPCITKLALDYLLFGQLALLGPCANLAVPLVEYRRHGESVGILNPIAQIEAALQVSRFLANSLSIMKSVPRFDPGPFCNHADYVFDFRLDDYTPEFERMACALRRGLGPSDELERELAFRRILAVRRSVHMAARYLQFRLKHAATPSEWRTVRNWLLRAARNGKYIYRG